MIKHLSSLFRGPLTARGLRKSSSALWISGGLAVAVLLGSVDTSYGYRLTNRDMRYFGYSGNYRGFVRGDVATWNGFGGGYDYRYNMSVIDNLDERAEFDGDLFSYWRIRGGLGK